MIVITTEQFRPSVGQKVGHYCEAILLSSYPPQSNRNCTLVLFSYLTSLSWWEGHAFIHHNLQEAWWKVRETMNLKN